mgnify:FL=1
MAADSASLVPSRGKIQQQLYAAARNLSFLRSIKQLVQDRLFAQKMRGLSDYLYWEPNYILSPFPGRAITTVHDLSHLRYPEYHPRARVAHLEKHLSHSIEQASHVIVVSEFTRTEVTGLLGIDAKHTSVVMPGISADYFPRDNGDLFPVLKRYGLSPGYLLSVGTLEPRKNLPGLLRAYLRLSPALRKKVPLVLVGAKGWNSTDTENMINRAERRGEIIRLGYVNGGDLPSIYAGALALAYPSFYEGFGMPLAEAMASGTAVITSNCSAMPEVVGKAGELVNPYMDDEIVAALELVLGDPVHREKMEKIGLKRAEQLTWSHSLDNLLATFRQVRR